MRSHVNAEQAARLRAARAEEDAAVALVNARSNAVDRARVRRTRALARLDNEVEAAKAELAAAVAGVVRTAGLDRAAFALGMSRGQLRRMLSAGKANATAPTHPAGPQKGAQ